MRITQKLDQRQSQTLSMTKQLQQAIRLLELSNLELANYLDQALLENPVLDAMHTAPEESKAVEAEPIEPHYDNENLWNSQSSNFAYKSITSIESEFDPFYKAAAPEKSLRDIIEEQIHLKIQNQEQQIIASNLLFYLESSGYLAPDYIELQETLKCPNKVLEEVLAVLQTFEPVGVFARTLVECLRPQLRAKGLITETVLIVLEHLQEFADGHVTKILKKYNITQEEFADAMMVIQAQNPKPGLEYDCDGSNIIIPDAYLSKSDQGWIVTLNENSLPRILLNNGYVTELNRNIQSSNDKKYINGCIQKANFIINALKQRADTLIRVCTEIAKRQVQFFQYGIRYLKPMTLKEIAQSLDLHESTISRVTTNKYIQTPRGTFELKYFFTSKLKAINNKKTLSSQAIKYRIKELVDNETKAQPLSDDELVNIMKEEDIQIARRTVAKYREAQNIPSSYERKKLYKTQKLFRTCQHSS